MPRREPHCRASRGVGSGVWRRGWDSNPRYALRAYTHFPGVLLRPLGHLSSAGKSSITATVENTSMPDEHRPVRRLHGFPSSESIQPAGARLSYARAPARPESDPRAGPRGPCSPPPRYLSHDRRRRCRHQPRRPRARTGDVLVVPLRPLPKPAFLRRLAPIHRLLSRRLQVRFLLGAPIKSISLNIFRAPTLPFCSIFAPLAPFMGSNGVHRGQHHSEEGPRRPHHWLAGPDT
jgi:hypothetical protein